MNGSVHAGIEGLIRSMNDAWLSGRFDDLNQYFAEDVVMVAPGGGMRMMGREAMIDSFRQYTEQATTHNFDETGLDVDVFESTAVASLRFDVDYELEGTRYQESGIDFLVLEHGDSGWLIVWRTQIPTAN